MRGNIFSNCSSAAFINLAKLANLPYYTVFVEEAERVSEPHLEPTECIVTELVPEQKVREMMRSGTIEHGLVLNALMFYFMEKSK